MALLYVVSNQIMRPFYQIQMWSSVSICMFIFLEYEVFFGGSNDQFMGLILVSF